jgi:hypothetical protein
MRNKDNENETGTYGRGRIAATNGETLAAVLPQMTKPKCVATKYA